MVAFQNPIVTQLIVPTGATTGARVVIGVGAQIQMIDANNNLVGNWIPSEFDLINPVTGGLISIQPVPFNGGNFPTIFFKTSPVSDVAFINAVPDGNGEPAIGINSPPYTDPGGQGTIFERAFLFPDAMQFGMVDFATQSPVYGFFISHLAMNIEARTPIFVRNANWTSVGFANGWGNFGNPFWGVSVHMMPDGTVMMRGEAAGPAASTGGTVVVQIPNGFLPTPNGAAPNGTLSFSVSGGAAIKGEMHITPQGACNLFSGIGSMTACNFDGISWASKF